MRYLIVSTVLFMTACSPVYVKETTKKQYEQDLLECQYNAVKFGTGLSSRLTEGFRHHDVERVCMRGRGYKPKSPFYEGETGH